MGTCRTPISTRIGGHYILASIALLALSLLVVTPNARADTRTTEFRFQLSNDAGSEFSAKLPVVTPGSLRVEAEWRPLNAPAPPASLPQTSLTLILLRYNGTEAARTSGTSPLRLEMQVMEQDIGRSGDRNRSTWTVKIVNGSAENRREVAGVLRAAIPISAGVLADTDFVLLGSGNAREIAFLISGPGRLVVESHWQTDPISAAASPASPLTVVLLHPDEGKTYVRKQSRRSIRIEQQITETMLDRGVRWVVRVQNDSAERVRGRLRVLFTPGK